MLLPRSFGGFHWRDHHNALAIRGKVLAQAARICAVPSLAIHNARRLGELERENGELKKLVANLSLVPETCHRPTEPNSMYRPSIRVLSRMACQ